MRSLPPKKTIKEYFGRPGTADLIAGVSIAGILIPEAIAYSGIANMPPQAGIIALFAGLICYGLLGSSRFAIVSATSSSAMMLAAAMASVAGGNAAVAMGIAAGLVIFAGVFFMIASWAKLGNMTAFIARPVLRGFTFGLAIIIIVKQIASISGLTLSGGNLFQGFWNLLTNIGQWNIYGVAIAAVSLALLFRLSRHKRIPGGFVVIISGIILSAVTDLPALGVKLVGSIDASLSMPSFPTLDRQQWITIAELGLSLSLILYSESYGSIRNYASRHGDEVYPNRDLFALGVSNVVSGLFNGMPVGAGYSATAANEAAGARSRWAGLISAGIIFLVILTILPLIALTPVPVLAAIVIYAVSHSLDPRVFGPYFKWKRDRAEIVVSVLGVLLFGIVNGLMIGIVISIALLLKRFADSSLSVLGRLGDTHDFVKLSRYPDARPVPGMMIFRPDQPLFFANCDRILNQVRDYILDAEPDIHCIIISMEESPDVDGTTIEALGDFFAFAAAEGKHLILTRLKEPVYEVLADTAAEYPDNVELNFLSVDDAVKLCGRLHDHDSV